MPLNTAFIGELKNESAQTQKILERVPLDNKEWKPHEKSMTLGRLSTHIAQIPHWISDIINMEEYDFAVQPYIANTAASREELMQIFREKLDTAIKDLEATGDETFSEKWTVRRGEQVFYTLPKKIAIRSFGLSHLIHHRGQLSVYLRLLDIPIPGMYGPSADERM